ncbi:MAG: M20/M25/M40 family metallo-hydrolase, partial [Chloroflexota bacterium]|nr:M20/M25/M40 family metallo-hydrolase [Chloroflexota bacterium]
MTVDLSRQHMELDARIKAALDLLDIEGLIEALVALVRVPSVYDPSRPDGNESAASGYVEALLRSWDMLYTRREVAPGRPNLVIDLPGVAAGPILVMEGHTDVVTVGDRAAWSVEPFAGEIRDGRLYGRGACDMKGGLVAMLFAARALQLAGSDYRGTLRLAILADEEGMMLGAKGFVADGYLDGATAAIVCEPEGDRVCIAQKGAIRLRARFHGKMAHGCMPDEGINPVPALGEAIVACRLLEQEVL